MGEVSGAISTASWCMATRRGITAAGREVATVSDPARPGKELVARDRIELPARGFRSEWRQLPLLAESYENNSVRVSDTCKFCDRRFLRSA